MSTSYNTEPPPGPGTDNTDFAAPVKVAIASQTFAGKVISQPELFTVDAQQTFAVASGG